MNWTHHHSSVTVKMSIKRNYDEVMASIEEACHHAHRTKDSVNVIAVTKYVDSSIAKELVDAGIHHIGENRVDKFLDKYKSLQDNGLVWHLIGSLQRRKVKDVINYVDYFHALDSLSLAAEIEKRATKTINCFLQVNISGEESKHGFAPEELDDVIENLRSFEHIRLVGLMTMAPIDANAEELDALFAMASEICQTLAAKHIPNMPFTELSMGMSGDFEQAIQNGATFVRIGSAFFR